MSIMDEKEISQKWLDDIHKKIILTDYDRQEIQRIRYEYEKECEEVCEEIRKKYMRIEGEYLKNIHKINAND